MKIHLLSKNAQSKSTKRCQLLGGASLEEKDFIGFQNFFHLVGGFSIIIRGGVRIFDGTFLGGKDLCRSIGFFLCVGDFQGFCIVTMYVRYYSIVSPQGRYKITYFSSTIISVFSIFDQLFFSDEQPINQTAHTDHVHGAHEYFVLHIFLLTKMCVPCT